MLRRFSNILRVSAIAYREQFAEFLMLSIIIHSAPLAFGFALYASNNMASVPASQIWPVIGVGLLNCLASFVGYPFLMLAAHQTLQHNQIKFKNTWNYFKTRLRDYIVNSLILTVLMWLGFLLFFVPGIIIALMYPIVLMSILLESSRRIDPLLFSWELLYKHWPLLIFLFLFSFLLIVPIYVGMEWWLGQDLGRLVSSVFLAGLMPFHILMSVELYSEARRANANYLEKYLREAPLDGKGLILGKWGLRIVAIFSLALVIVMGLGVLKFL